MILAIDMGNSNIKIGVVKDIDNVIEERVSTAHYKSSLEYGQDILAVLNFHSVHVCEIEGAILSSVVPALTGVVATAIRKVLRLEPIIVSCSMKMDIGLHKFQYPKGIGPDLIVGMEAAYYYYPTPCISVNMGTATTVTVVDSDGEYLGGAILPGMKTSLNALTQNAAMLPEISLEDPGRLISQNTERMIRGGIMYGNAAQIDGLVERVEEELGTTCHIVATGGMARFVVPYCKNTKRIVRDDALLMKGLMRLYELNKTDSNSCKAD
ncbi:MAG: type III pantothenate kinase [Eubacteriales bacterium]|nr:type III pantothenate kinase [Eubacteriales bacterium]